MQNLWMDFGRCGWVFCTGGLWESTSVQCSMGNLNGEVSMDGFGYWCNVARRSIQTIFHNTTVYTVYIWVIRLYENPLCILCISLIKNTNIITVQKYAVTERGMEVQWTHRHLEVVGTLWLLPDMYLFILVPALICERHHRYQCVRFLVAGGGSEERSPWL